nr:unnamed protein product [Callosobruchus analis]
MENKSCSFSGPIQNYSGDYVNGGPGRCPVKTLKSTVCGQPQIFRTSIILENVFECADGTPILFPFLRDNSYYDRKSSYALKLQGICNSSKNLLMSHMDGQEAFAVQERGRLSKGSYLLGDSAYPSDFLITLFRHNGNSSRQQKLFNQKPNISRETEIFKCNKHQVCKISYVAVFCKIIKIDDNTVCDIEEYYFSEYGENPLETDTAPSELRNAILLFVNEYMFLAFSL